MIKNPFLHMTASTLVSVCFLTACSFIPSDEKVTDPSSLAEPTERHYCYKGGRANEFSCDPDKASPQPDMRSAEIDEVWMWLKLIEIKRWLSEQKDYNNSVSSTQQRHEKQ
ncbi:hypothetical protein ACMXYR_03930 [Neptuniibacter sp. QD29_5]|uniref:hypothetical protein n=1 Tax=Neptuniibacter sp. QD29_5 TaxID=3398207 RepID=UPI0039F537C5